MTKFERMLKKIDHINVVVQNLIEAKKFFVDLGFDVTHEGVLTGVWIDKVTNLANVKAEYCTLSLPGSQTNLELIQYTTPEDQTKQKKNMPNMRGFRHLAFEVANIDAVVAKLKKDGVTFFSEIQHYEPTKKKLCYLYGPEGIILELAEYSK
jgi:catechol 2,3-dioxygenase-like lactoylglutathione lyase family enzyme